MSDSETFRRAVHEALEASPIPALLRTRPAAVLERLAWGAGNTNWYYCRHAHDLGVIEKCVAAGSLVSFYFDNRMRLDRLTAHVVEEMKGILARNGDVVVAVVSTEAVVLESEPVTHVDELLELVASFDADVVVLYGTTPFPDNDGADAVTITVPDLDGVIRAHAN